MVCVEYESQQHYQHLVPWCQTVLDSFVEDECSKYNSPFLRTVRNAVARFLDYLTGRGGQGFKDITHRLVAEYYRDDKHCNYKAKDRYDNYVCKFLRYIADKELIVSSIPMALDKFVLPRLVFISDMELGERAAFRDTSGTTTLTAKEFRVKTVEMKDILRQHRYSDVIKKEYSMALSELFIFLEANLLAYSVDIAIAWATHMRRYTAQWKAFQRAVMLFEQYRTEGRIDPQRKYSYRPDRADALPDWCKGDYTAYMKLIEREGFAQSTLDMHRSACLRLMEYFDAAGVLSWGGVTAETLKEFHRHDPHSTPEARNAYSSKIRCFLEYLGEIGRVPPALFLAVPGESAPRISIIKTLDDFDIDDIYRYKKTANNAMKLRDTAIIMLGLRMGLRASDISKLKLGDISWEQGVISVRQQKTKKFVKLPMPVEAGNAIYRYITQGRPETGSEFVFIAHRAPYGRMRPGVCARALRNVLPSRTHGFHITRKTFASRMLVNNVAAGRIAETLGHADNSSVMTYLSTNDDKMRLCALSLEGVQVNGGALS